MNANTTDPHIAQSLAIAFYKNKNQTIRKASSQSLVSCKLHGKLGSHDQCISLAQLF